MTKEKRLEIGLFVMRLSIGIFFLALILQNFLTTQPSYLLVFFAAVLLIVFLSGLDKKFSYAGLIGIQLASAVSMYNVILDPLQLNYILFWTHIPVIGALIGLFLLREHDQFFGF
ncbi:MAG: hypothetical protein HC787_04830 [Nostocaceae cyanobacterium CSU_2_110]|nr:hypothetical protein [Nostocaceae cyanobacterium CSU_2_110]